ncbi:monovalent cation/H(+) antiporter subunit G [Elioraea tepidiphila]|uniref:monovalent cation/H(+) antiporter subunit G n=1 Tax=Elioraea tepidiphila TaxID=457934 RepID=UPI001B7FBF07|nr:monovalent cation/H(+) antiporter subunit G [Elioraea tepidiphila]
MTQLVLIVLVLAGSGFALIAAIGIWRLPDALMRMHASSKSGTLGGGLLFFAVAIGVGEFDVVVRALAGVAFLLFTTPIASHLIARATYLLGVPRDPSQVRDDLEGRYDLNARVCQAPADVVAGASSPVRGADSPSTGTGGGAA